MKSHSFQSKAQEVKNQTTDQTHCFQYFISDMCRFDAQTAYENFLKGYRITAQQDESAQPNSPPAEKVVIPEAETIEQAKIIIKALHQHMEDFTKDRLPIKNYEFTKQREDVVNGFFNELNCGGTYDEALRNAIGKMQRDPVLSKDHQFMEQFKTEIGKLKPKKLQKSHYSIGPAQGMIFQINISPGQYYDKKISKDKIKEEMYKSLFALYNQHLPENLIPSKEAIEIDINTIMLNKRPSIGSTLATMDVLDITKLSTEEASRAHSEIEDIAKNNKVYMMGREDGKKIFENVKTALKDFKANPKLSRTERVDIIRDLIIDLNQPNLTEKQKEIVFDNIVDRCKVVTPIEQLRKQGIDVTQGQELTLAQILEKQKDNILKQPTHKVFSDLLEATYANVLRWDKTTGKSITHERTGIELEVEGLMKGTRSASVSEALFEIGERRLLYIQARVYNKEIKELKAQKNQAPHGTEHKQGAHRKNKLEYEVWGGDSHNQDNSINMN